MNKLGQRVLVYAVGNLIVWGIVGAVANKMEGKTIFGRVKKKPSSERTYVDWKGNIQLGTRDYQVV